MLFAAIVLLFGVTLAQRPPNATICDYYAMNLYGVNTSLSQFQLMQGIVALAFSGGANLPNVSSNITGILNPGTFQGNYVDLQPYFNGSIDSTNLNNQPVGIDWLDGGGVQPLHDFLSGVTPNVTINNSTNEYRLFSHFFRAFAFVFGCTLPPPAPKSAGGQLSLAYVHKYMGLNYTQLGHFIDQLTTSALHFGFSQQDSDTLSSQMNAKYNVRCSPPVQTSPNQPAQLFSLCQASSCPLAAPISNCEVYNDLGPSGVSSPSSTGGPSSSATATPFFSPTTISSAATSTNAQTSSAAPSHSSSSAALAPGAIAGVAIGGAAVLFIFIGVLVFLLRNRRPRTPPPHPYVPPPSNPSYASSPYPTSPYNPHQSQMAPSYSDPHTSYQSGGHVELWSPPPVEMDSPRFAGGGSPEMAQRPK